MDSEGPEIRVVTILVRVLAICALALAGCEMPDSNGENDDEVFIVCCMPDGSCDATGEGGCEQEGGTLQFNLVSCDNDPCNKGACCNNGTCTLTKEADCENRYQGDATDCDSGLCSLGACCIDDEELLDLGLGNCLDEDRESCLENRLGEWKGLDTACEPSRPCGGEPTQGACCSDDGKCELTERFLCEEFDPFRSYAGDGVDCTDKVCESGACCERDQGCVQAPRFGCFDTYMGGGTRCEDISCEETIGACCMGDGTCDDSLDKEICEDGFDGTFEGAGSSCFGVICSATVGACCIEDGRCVEITRDACIARTPALSTSFAGVGTKCVFDGGMLCDNPSGACCLGTACQVLKEAQCVFLEGTYLGDNFLCTSPTVAAMCDP